MRFLFFLLSLSIATFAGAAEDAAERAKEFKNLPKDKIHTTDSGLQYIDVKKGTGASPRTNYPVAVHYTGWLLDGTKFDSSVDRGKPFMFLIGVGEVIPGWDEGVSTMKVGGKRRLIVPAKLAYGEAGAGAVIPPNATLVFDVELLDAK